MSNLIKVIRYIQYWRIRQNENIPDDTPVKKMEKYIENEKKRFLKTYELDDKKMNENTDSLFYDFEKYNECTLQENNEFEKKWKSRILFETTPNGNIIMFYDTYKKGFAYYSDQNIPYSLLNSIAMKYVRIFLCRDLFIDNKITPDINPSPLIELEESENKKKTVKNKTENPSIGIDKEIIKNAPFAKLKKYNLETKHIVNNDENGKKLNQEKESNINKNLYSINRFIYSGKIANFSFVQKTFKKKKNIKTKYFKQLFDEEHELQEEIISYKHFKEKIKK